MARLISAGMLILVTGGVLGVLHVRWLIIAVVLAVMVAFLVVAWRPLRWI
jgi:hypothetical protein